MSEIITVHGNVTAEPDLYFSRGGVPVGSFSIASNRRRFDRQSGQWRDRPAVFYRVVCFNRLAENAAATLHRGTTVTITGEFTDDSYTPEGADTPIRRIQMQASEVAVSLKYATAEVMKNPKTEPAGPAEPADAQPATGEQPDGDPAEASSTAAA